MTGPTDSEELVTQKPLRVYQLTPAKYALANIRLRRLKISEISKLNDPFELMPIEAPTRAHRRYLKAVTPRSSDAWLFTKFAHWSYEDEVRFLANLEESEDGKYFIDFGPLKLVQVIVGCCSTVTRAEVLEALGPDLAHVELIKARQAFRSFRVVRDRGGLK